MGEHEDVVLAADAGDLGTVLGCSEDQVLDLCEKGMVASRGELWDVGSARSYLRDAAWADGLWD